MIAHTFTCPTGLYFNSITDGCDFRRNVDCEGKDDTEEKKSKKDQDATTESSLTFDDDDDGEEQTVEQILEKIKNAGKFQLVLLNFTDSFGTFKDCPCPVNDAALDKLFYIVLVPGGLEAFEENLRREEEEKEAIKQKEEERRKEISTKTRNNLSRLLDRKRAESKDELRR